MKQELTDECLRDLARPHFSKGYNDQIFDVVGFGRELLADKDAEIAALREALAVSEAKHNLTKLTFISYR